MFSSEWRPPGSLMRGAIDAPCAPLTLLCSEVQWAAKLRPSRATPRSASNRAAVTTPMWTRDPTAKHGWTKGDQVVAKPRRGRAKARGPELRRRDLQPEDRPDVIPPRERARDPQGVEEAGEQERGWGQGNYPFTEGRSRLENKQKRWRASNTIAHNEAAAHSQRHNEAANPIGFQRSADRCR